MQFQGYILYWEDPKNPEAFRSIYGTLEHWTHPENGEPPKIYANANHAKSAKLGVKLPTPSNINRDEIQILPVTIAYTPPKPKSLWHKFEEIGRALSS